MDSRSLPRKLAAVLYADVAEYSRLTGEDEEGTHRRLSDYLDCLSNAVVDHAGRVVHYAGDAVLADFATVTDALNCAVAVQRDLAERNSDLPEDRKVNFRVGVNLGEVILDRNDIYGDGVNVAARLQSLADPGGICISESVRTAVGNHLPLDYEFLGEQQVKNIAEPVRAYRILLEDGVGSVLSRAGSDSRNRAWVVITVVGVVVLAGLVAWWNSWHTPPESISPQTTATVAPAQRVLSLPDKPSLAVLPFSNMSNDTQQEYFVDGMTEDLITDLSKLSGLFVIARNSSFAYKGKSPDVRQVSEELGVKYVLEGSVRRAGDAVRINAQLIDATTGGHLWAERYDGTISDVFELQDKVARKIVSALEVVLQSGESAPRSRPETSSAEAYDSFLHGWSHFRRGTPRDFARAEPFLKQAIEFDPDYSRAYAALAALYTAAGDRNTTLGTTAWTAALRLGFSDSLRMQEQYLEKAMKDPVPLAHLVASRRFSRHGQHEAALEEARQALKLDPNDPAAYESMASALIYAGRPAEAIAQIDFAVRLDPRYRHEYLYWRGLAEFGMSRFDDAVDTLAKVVAQNPEDDRSHLVLAAAYGQLGKVEEARRAVAYANDLRTQRQQKFAGETSEIQLEAGIDQLLAGPYTLEDANLWYFREKADRERLREGLRLAGLPEVGEKDEVSPIEVAGATSVDVTMAKTLFDRGVKFIDVLQAEMWNNGHIPGAINLDYKGEFTEAALLAVVAKDEEVVIYCMGPRCLRSSQACAKAVSWGFTRVYYFREGLPSWKAAGYPIELPKDI